MRYALFLLPFISAVPATAASLDMCGMMVMPTAGVAELSSGFGFRWGNFHTGLDFRGPMGSPIHAVASGEVIHAGPYGAYGLAVEILHAGGVVTRYAHMSRIASNLAPGTMVSAQQEIGALGSTGRSTGPHLHLEVRINGRPVDPAPWLALSASGCNITPETVTEEARANGRSTHADSLTTARLMTRGRNAVDSTTRLSMQQQALAEQNRRSGVEATEVAAAAVHSDTDGHSHLGEYYPTESELSADAAATRARMARARTAGPAGRASAPVEVFAEPRPAAVAPPAAPVAPASRAAASSAPVDAFANTRAANTRRSATTPQTAAAGQAVQTTVQTDASARPATIPAAATPARAAAAPRARRAQPAEQPAAAPSRRGLIIPQTMTLPRPGGGGLLD